MMVQHTCAISILRHAIVVYEGLSKLSVLLRGPRLSLFDMLLVAEGGLKT
jgi:hypothetical protein